MLIDIVDNLIRNVVTNALSALAEQADLGGRDIVLNELRDDTDVVLPFLKAYKCVICTKSIHVHQGLIPKDIPISVPLRSRMKAP